MPDSLESDFSFDEDAFTFVNFGTESAGSDLTVDLAVRLFGAEAVCVPGMDPCVARAEAQLWIDEVNETLAYGHSEGMAVTALLMSLGKVAPSDFGAAIGSELTVTPALSRELAYWAATQKLPQAHDRDVSFQAKDVMPFLAQALKPGNGEGWRLLVAMKDGERLSGGHALVPFGYFKGERDGLYVLRLYDSNMPQAEQRLTIDVTGNSWSYEGSYDTALTRTYVGNAENGNLLHFSPATARQGQFVAPFSANGTLTVSGDKTTISVRNEAGAMVGFENGVLKEQGGRLIPATADCLCRLPNEIVNIQMNADAGTSTQTLSVSSNGLSDSATVNITGAGTAVKVTGVQTSGGADTVTVSNGGKTVTYASGGDSNIGLTTSVTGTDGRAKTVTVTVGGTSKSVTVDGSDPNTIAVKLDNVPAGTKVTVTVTEPDGLRREYGLTSGSTQDSLVTIDTRTAKETIDTNVVFESCKNNKKDADESDVDCGAACSMKPTDERFGSALCAEGKRCTTAADCQSLNGMFCKSGICSRPSCTDGIKNQDETDVDCGNVNGCAACRTGQLCKWNGNCQTDAGMLCTGYSTAGGFCGLRSKHTVRAVGLPPGEWARSNAQLDQNTRELFFSGNNANNIEQFGAEFSIYLVKPTTSSKVVCEYRGAQANGAWAWSLPADAGAGPFPQFVTLDCRLSRGTLSYRTTGACPDVIDGRTAYGSGGTIQLKTADSNGVFGAPYHVGIRSGGWLADLAYRPPGLPVYQVLQAGGAGILETYVAGQPYRSYRQSCTPIDTGDGTFPASGERTATLSCSCDLIVPTDGGSDAGADAGPVDAGSRDAGPPDAGPPDAGPPDAGPPDAGATGGACTTDSQCPSNDCYCSDQSGNCAGNSGRCGAGRFVVSTPTTDGVAASGTITVPAGCTSLAVRAWGAAGGGGASAPLMPGFPGLPNTSGGGGYVGGLLSAAPGDVLTVWVGNGGDSKGEVKANGGVGSYLGTPANGGAGDLTVEMSLGVGGRGGGLTSVRQSGSAFRSFSVPAGSGAGGFELGLGGGSAGGGTAPGRSGTAAMAGTSAGGGGAGENGGLGGTNSGAPGAPGAFGSLPSGLTSTAGSGSVPGQGSHRDLGLCPSNAGYGQQFAGGNGCVVVRCVSP